MLVLLLTATAVKTMKKGIKKYHQETAQFERQATLKMDNLSKGDNDFGYSSLGDGMSGDLKDDAASMKVNPDRQNADSVLKWTPAEVKTWWERSLPPGCQEYIHIVDECELDGTDLLDLDYISLSQFDVKKMLIMKILRRIKQLKQSLGIQEVANSGGAVVKVMESDNPNDQNGAQAKAR